METHKTLSRCTLALIHIWASEADAFSFVHCRGFPHDSRPYPGIGCIPEVPSCLLASYSCLLFGQGKTGNPSAQAPYKDSPFISMLKSRGLLARFGKPGFISLLRCGLPACALSAQMSLIPREPPHRQCDRPRGQKRLRGVSGCRACSRLLPREIPLKTAPHLSSHVASQLGKRHPFSKSSTRTDILKEPFLLVFIIPYSAFPRALCDPVMPSSVVCRQFLVPFL